jgi:fibronectin-binding autotransporter adhesin
MDHPPERLEKLEQQPYTVERQRPRWRGLALVIIMLAAWAPVQAAVLPCPGGDVRCLIAAIQAANGTVEADTITLAAGAYTVTTVDHEADGANGLPSITSPLMIQGAGADRTILERDTDAPGFRLLHVGAEGALRLEGLTVRGGSEGVGGGLLNFGDLRITHSRLTNNRAGDSGGGLANRGGAVTIVQSVVANNNADAGGGLWSVDGTVEITESSFRDNSVSHPGGAIWTCGGTATIAASTFVRNGGDPGAIVNDDCFGATGAGTMTIVSTTVADSNSNTDGGLSNSGTMHVRNSAIVRNRAEAFDAGGIGNRGTLTLVNTTVAENIGDSVGGIGNSGTLTLINTTVADNRPFTAEHVGGLLNAPGGTVVLVNTILARNAAEAGVADCAGSVTSRGHNLLGDPAGCTVTIHPTDLTGEPGLGSLVEDGTPGGAHLPLLANSRAINAGNDKACPPTDQLRQPRVGRCDIGAVEFRARRHDAPRAVAAKRDR